MNVSKESKDKVRELARRFTNNSPNLCRDHDADGLPIDAPNNINPSENHPSYKFEKIVNMECDKMNVESDTKKSQCRMILREEFSKVFYKNSSKIDCIKCDKGSIKVDKIPDKFADFSE